MDGMKNILKRVNTVFSRGSETLFLLLLTLKILDYLVNRIWWNVAVPYLDTIMAHVKLTVLLVTLWVLAMTISFCLFARPSEPAENGEQSLWRRLYTMSGARLLLMVITCLIIGFLLRFLLEKSAASYTVIVCTALILLSSGRNYRKTERTFLLLFTGVIVVSATGLLLGFTYGGVKVGAYGTGFSLGMTYPNTWARAFFLVILLIWYERLQEKPVWTFALFWLAAILTLLVVKCRTIALLLILFPIAAWLKGRFTARMMNGSAVHRSQGTKRVLKTILIAMPFICFIITLLLCSQMELLHKLTYGNYLRNMSKRFVQGGIALKEYGLPLLGRSVDLGHNITVLLNGKAENLYVLDCGYISYGLSRGMIWLCAMLAWQSFANHRCIRNKDYSMLLIGLFMSLLALMEREGFDPWYNLTLLYPLAKTNILKASVRANVRVKDAAG